MRSCAVLGNGPSLKVENIPAGAFLIGVNRSYKVAWSPIVCATEGEPARAAYAESGAFAFFVKRGALPIGMRGVTPLDPPEWAYNAGAFGIWCAAEMRFDRIHLVGFGGDGHFDGSGRDFRRDYYLPNIEAAIEYAEAIGAAVVRAEVMV